jgi:hypothetical protein
MQALSCLGLQIKPHHQDIESIMSPLLLGELDEGDLSMSPALSFYGAGLLL